MYCDNCGNKNLDNDKFCENCGNSLNEDNTISAYTKPKKRFKVIYIVLFVLFIGEYFIYNSNNELSSEIRYVISSNNSISNIREERRQAEIQRQNQRQSYSSGSSSSSSYGGSGQKYGCKFHCVGQWEKWRGSEFHVSTPATNSMDAERYVRDNYTSTCQKYPFYSGGGGRASVGVVKCETYY